MKVFGPFALDAGNATLSRDGTRLDVAPKAFDLLVLLASRPGQLVTKDEILDSVWGRRFVSESAVKSVVSSLRAVLDDDAREPRWIETVSRRGYRFVGAPVERAPGPAAALARVAAAAIDVPVEALPDGAGDDAQTRAAGTVIDRAAARDVLERAWAAAQRGQRQLVFVAGEPGMGKTTLLADFARRLEGAALAHGQCVENYGSAEPYLPVLEALNTLCGDDPRALAAVRDVAPTWLVQMPWHLDERDRAALQRDVTGASQGRMLREMGMLLEQLSAQAPLVLLLEDLHWSDAPTVQLLDHLMRRRAPARLLVAASFRPAEVIVNDHPVANLRRELRLHRLCEEVHLDGFSREQIAAFVGARFDGARPGAAFVAALERHTDGLPLFLASVLDELADDATIRRDAGGGWRLPDGDDLALPLPDNLLGLAEKQMQRLPAQTRQLLEVAALSAQEFDHLSLARAMDLDAGMVRERLDHLARRKLWLRACEPRQLQGGLAMRYAFVHALFRHAFAHRVGAAARIERHRRLGQALEKLHGDRAGEIAGELAQHHADGGDPARAGHWYAVAAGQAMQRIAPHEALALAGRGLMQVALLGTQAPPEVELPLLSVRIGALMVTQGYSTPAAAPALERAQALMARQPLAAATAPLWHCTWWALLNSGTWSQVVSLTDRLLEQGGEGAPPVARAVAHALSGTLATFSNRYEDAIADLRTALDAQRAFTPDDWTLPFVQDLRIEALSNLLLSLEACARFDEADAVQADIERRIAEGADPLSEAMGLWFMTCARQLRGDPGSMRKLGMRALALMRARAALPGEGPHRVSLGWALVMEGEVRDGLAEAQQGVRHYQRQGSVMGMGLFRATQAEALAAAGELDAARDAITAAMQHTVHPHCVLEAAVHRIHGVVCWASGEAAAAMRAWEQAIAQAHRQGARLLEMSATADLARALAETGRRWEAHDRLAEVLERVGPAPGCPAVQRARAQLAGLAASAPVAP
jgi:DNA-binding winged helix-turn-helix (wHTH) protein/tetratricopeptide (TPR) repeat protein